MEVAVKILCIILGGKLLCHISAILHFYLNLQYSSYCILQTYRTHFFKNLGRQYNNNILIYSVSKETSQILCIYPTLFVCFFLHLLPYIFLHPLI